ncbi:MAG: hypothetical protein RBS99_14925 [Rhodospirillales bacterium]|jgi:hypothetical protein|nr:hypothetical protein [Rhodospirillales bacterium]
MTLRRCLAPFAILAILAIPPRATFAAIFANDILYLHDGGEPVTDDSVIVVLRPGTPQEAWEICPNGRFFLRQGPQWSPGPHRFARTRGPDVPSFESWSRSAEGRATTDPWRSYLRHLRDRAADAARTAEIVIPDLDQSPPLVRKEAPPPRPGMAEGRLGFDRHFTIDLASGAVTQVPTRPW